MRKLKSWQKILLASAVVIVPILSCSQRSLVLVDVQAPQGAAYANVTVVITVAGMQKTTFDKVTFDAAGMFKAGVYVPSDMTGDVAVHADVNDDNCMVGSGDASTKIASEGETTMAVDLPITPASVPCVAGTGGSGSATGGAAGMMASGGSFGSGGSGGLTGSAGGGGAVGAGGVGAGGVTGNAGSPGMGGKGGVTGAGGANATGGRGGTGAGGVTGTGGVVGAGGSPTTGAGGSPTTGAGGSPTTGSGGVTGNGGGGGKGGSGTTGSGGIGGATGAGGVGTGGGGGCTCPTNFVCLPGTTACVCSQSDTEACADIACGSTTNVCQQTVSCPNTCPVGYTCLNNLCRQLTTTGCGGDIVTTGTGLVAGTAAAPPACPAQ